MIRRGTCLLAALCGLSFASIAHADDALNDQELLRLFPGTFQAVVKGKYEVTVKVTRDGAPDMDGIRGS